MDIWLEQIASVPQLWHHWDNWGQHWNRTVLICRQEWHYQRVHLCWEWDPSHDLQQILIALGQKSVCVCVCVRGWALSGADCNIVRTAVNGFSVCMSMSVGGAESTYIYIYAATLWKYSWLSYLCFFTCSVDDLDQGCQTFGPRATYN